jgi:pimeloyl-ACP methyl ester carboxylesterase
MATIEVRGFRCFYAEFGQGGPPIVLLHGWSGDSTDWSAQIPDLAERARVIVLDLRGHGRSQATRDGYEAVELGRDVIAVLEALALGPADLVGHSLGGILASFVALRRPDLVRSLLLVDPAYGQPPARCGEVMEIIGDPDSADSGRRATVAADLPSPLSDEAGRRRSARRRLQAEGLGSHVVWETFRGMFCGPGGLGVLPTSEALVRDRRHPTLAIYAYRPTWEWERSLSSTPERCLLWQNVSHFLHDDHPDRFNAAASAWLTTVDRELGAAATPVAPARGREK